MATRVELPPLPASVAILPLLFMSSRQQDRDLDFRVALAAAAAAEQADTEKRNMLRRVAYLLCELGCQYGRRTGQVGGPMPLSRAELARALGVSLSRVKRILGLLGLSGVIATGEDYVEVLDWGRLCAVAGYDAARLGIRAITEADAAGAGSMPEAQPGTVTTTAAGDPACFV